jgi:hypothetical protein
MTRTARLQVRVAKEIRELAPAWLACLLAMAATAGLQARGAFDGFRGLGMLAYFLGMSALGALAIGHEYSHRTVSLLLSQPARRADLLLVKLGVLLAMLLTLTAVAGVVLVAPGGLFSGLGSPQPESAYVWAALWLPVLCGLFVAPWLTMLCRNPIAGAVFAMSLPGALASVGTLLVWTVKYGLGATSATPMEELQFAILWKGTLVFCAVGAVMTWRMFMRLEAIDGPGQDVRLPHWLVWRSTIRTAAPARSKRHPLWLLARKELRLQRITLIVAGVHVLGWLAVVSLRTYLVPDVVGIFFVLTIFYAMLVSLLIGSLASAEERQFGTLAWQVLLPMATWKQWALKVGVSLGLAIPLAVGLPLLLSSISPPTNPLVPGPTQFGQRQFTAWIILLNVGSLYVSSLSTSGLRALLVSLTAMFGATLFLVESPGSAVFGALVHGGVVPLFGVSWADHSFMRVLALLLAAGFLAMVLRFALANHRSADRPAGRVWKQAIWMAGCLTIGVILLAGVVAFYRL